MVDPPPNRSTSSFQTRLILVVLLAILARLGAIATARGFEDPDNYLPLARSLASGEGFALKGRPTAYRPPLYPLLLAPLVATLGDRIEPGIAGLHLLLGAGTVALTGLAARRLGVSDRRAVLASLIVACDPTLVWQARSVMTETLAAFLIATSLLAFTVNGWRGWILGGITLGIGGLCRPSLLAGGSLCCAGYAIFGPGRIRERVRGSFAIGGMIALALLPWTVRNARVFGEPVWTTTHGGYTLALANNPVYYRDVLNGRSAVWTGHDQWLWWDSVNRETAGMAEPDADRFMKARVIRLARDRPNDFVRASVARLGRFWSVAPASSVYPWPVRLASALFTIPVWVALVAGLVGRACWTWPRVTAPLQILGLTIVHTFYWTDMRMRSPIIPAIAIVAAGAYLSARRARPAIPSSETEPTDSRRPPSATSKS
jgi:4-amino-4-deoxy-L-arabinose transferase-like glycosyltransferase